MGVGATRVKSPPHPAASKLAATLPWRGRELFSRYSAPRTSV